MSAAIDKAYSKAMATVGHWKNELDRYTKEDFARTPGEGQWTIGQVYAHLMLGATMFMLPNAEKCLQKVKTQNGSKNLNGKIIFLLGGFPPIRVKVPEALAQFPTPQPESPEVVKAGLEALLVQLGQVKDKMNANFDPNHKRKHPVLGMLNALEWFQNVEMHFRHHLRQKKRLDKFLGK
jgi:hypothetical protein